MLTPLEKYQRRTMRRNRAYDVRQARRRTTEPRECVSLSAQFEPVDMTFVHDGRFVQKARARQEALKQPMGGFFWSFLAQGFRNLKSRTMGGAAAR